MIPSLAELRTRALPLLAAAIGWACSACVTSSRVDFRAPEVATLPPQARLAVLPIDVGVTVDGMEELEPEELEEVKAQVVAEVRRLVLEELPKRGYDVTALDWDGSGLVDPAAIEDMVEGMVAHANAVAWKNPPGGTIDPELTRYLGENTGAGAILYVNGTALANTSGKKTWQALAVVGAVLVVVGTIAAAASAGKSRSGGGRSVARSPGSDGHHLHRPSPHYHHHHHGPLLVGPVIFVSHRSGPAPAPVERVEAVEEPGFFDGERVRLTATLVDAETGTILWHADEQQGLDPRDAGELSDYLDDLLEGLPRGSLARPTSG